MELFKISCKANSAEEARHATWPQHGRQHVYKVEEAREHFLDAVNARRTRALSNPALYSDKIAEYDVIERKLYELFDSEEPPPMQVIEAMRLNGDGRLTDRSRVCALWVSGDHWIVFGAT